MSVGGVRLQSALTTRGSAANSPLLALPSITTLTCIPSATLDFGQFDAYTPAVYCELP